MDMEVDNTPQSKPDSYPEVKDRRIDALGDLRVLPDEMLCALLVYLTPRDVARLSCVSSVMYILCNEEPLWMSLCLGNVNRQLEYKGSWKKTTLHQLDIPYEDEGSHKKPLHFDGFYSFFLYKRYYRCYTTLNEFSFDNGNVERRNGLSLEDFHREYDGQKPVLIDGLAANWPARKTWTTEQLLLKYGDTKFKISQRSARKITMKFRDYVTYLQIQHDEDPLYIFDEKFGEAVPELLKEYSVPHLFQEDFFDVLGLDKRPAFRWLIIGPERSGASWHVDPALTSAWNTLLSGRKRWALYPPGKVPLGVTVHVNEEDGDVNIETPSSLQWWLDIYPLLADEDKPIECTQHPGETIFVPSGWWHCVLNLETTVAVTQNFVNSKNFEFVCLDMAPGYRHKGVCRAGLLAIEDGSFETATRPNSCMINNLSHSDTTRKEKRARISDSVKDFNSETTANCFSKFSNLRDLEYSYDIEFLAKFLDKEKDHYSSLWSSSNSIGQREMREWLCKLWVGRPELRQLIWKGACIALNADRWFDCMREICNFHGLSPPLHDERLPLGTGSNPVYLVPDYVIKIFVEGGVEASLYALGTELQFYSLLDKISSPLKNHIPDVLASGIIFLENGSYTVLPWDGRGVPEVVSSHIKIPENHKEFDYPFGIWSKKQFEYQNADLLSCESVSSGECTTMWPYIVTKRCRGEIFAELRETLSEEDAFNLASFLGQQLRNLHLVPFPPLSGLQKLDCNEKMEMLDGVALSNITNTINIPSECNLFVSTLNKKMKDVQSRLNKWGDPIPVKLIEKVHEYIPDDFAVFFNGFQDEKEDYKSCTWIHSDVMDDNIYMQKCCISSCSEGNTCDAVPIDNGNVSSTSEVSWRPSYILDFSDLSIGDPLLDLIPMHLDVFRGDSVLLKQFLETYKLPFLKRSLLNESTGNMKFLRLSYRAMCYCILHDENVLAAIFSLWKELRTAKSWEEVEETVWGDLNSYNGFSS